MQRREGDVSRIAKCFNRLLAHNRNDHLKLVDGDGALTSVIAPSTLSDRRSLLNLRADLRRTQAGDPALCDPCAVGLAP